MEEFLHQRTLPGWGAAVLRPYAEHRCDPLKIIKVEAYPLPPGFFVSVDSKGGLSLAESPLVQVLILRELGVNIILRLAGR